MTLAYLPTPKVEIAFNPTNIFTTPGTWTDVTTYLRDFNTRHGRQHYLDRIEAGTIDLTLDNRTGYFLNGTTNGTGYVLQPRLPIRVTATWSGTSYSVFYGLIDSIEEIVHDQQNIDVRVVASDLTKQLSLRYLSNKTFYPGFAKVASTQNYYRLGGTQPYVVTSASCNGTTATYQCNNAFTAGQVVSIYGLVKSDGTVSPLNLANVSVATANSTQFTVTTGTTATTAYNQNGVAYVSQTTDLVGGTNTSLLIGQVSLTQNGAMVYDPQNATDISNGSTNPSAFVEINANVGAAGSSYGADFWILGAGLNTPYGGLTTTVLGNVNSGGTIYAALNVDSQGFLYLNYFDPTHLTANYYVKDGSGNNIQVADGYWHHVGYHIISGTLYVYCDGNFTSTGITTASLTAGYNVGTFGGGTYATAPCYAQDVVVVGSTITQAAVKNRYIAGALLQRGRPVNGEAIYSGTRICELLVLAGYGGIDSTQTNALISASGVFYVDTVDVSTVNPYTTAVGTLLVEPYYWDSPVYGSTALDLIFQVTDTDTGPFWQRRDGSFYYYSQKHYGTWTWSSSTSTGTWSSSYATSTAPIWSDVKLVNPVASAGAYTIPAPGATFTVNVGANKNLWVGAPVFIDDGAGDTVTGTVTAYSGSTLTVKATSVTGSGAVLAGSDVTNTSLFGINYVATGLSILRDDADTWTTVKITPQAGIEQVYENTANQPRWGYTTLSKGGTLHASLNDALSTANYLGYLYRSPLPRVNSLTLEATAGNGVNVTSMLNTMLGDVVTFQRLVGSASASLYSTSGSYPDVKGQISQNMVVENIVTSFSADPGTWSTTFILDPYPVRS